MSEFRKKGVCDNCVLEKEVEPIGDAGWVCKRCADLIARRTNFEAGAKL